MNPPTPNNLNLNSIKGDVFGGVTAAVVALPLALAFGVASGVGPIAGLYGAIAVGFFAAVFGGTPSQVSGPTGPMTVLMAVIVANHADNLSQAFAIVFLAGAIQIVFGLLKIGRYVSYTPYSVVSGFMSGIGVIIILIQSLPFFGLPTVPGGPVGAIESWHQIPSMMNLDATVLACVALAIMIFWPTRFQTFLPPALAALLVGSVLGFFVFDFAPVIGGVPTGFPSIELPSFSIGELASLLEPAILLALLGSIDSLLTSLVADSITKTRHNSNKELVGQGIGNMVASVIGGLPGAGATMRTVVNVRAGGRTPLSGALHALILLALVLGMGPLAEKVPHAVLAGILVKVGWDIIDWRYLRRIRRAPLDKVIVMLVTLGLTVFVDLITAVAVGIILASFVTARWMEREQLKGVRAVTFDQGDDALTEIERSKLQKYNGKINIIKLRGTFSYASARELVKHIGISGVGYEAIVLDFTHASYIDTSAAFAIEELINTALKETSACFISGLSGNAEVTLHSLNVLDTVSKEYFVSNLTDAIEMAGTLIENKNPA